MEIIIDEAKLGKDIVVKNGNKHIAIDICKGTEGCLMFATTENKKVNIKHSVHNQEFCEFIAEVIETLNKYHEAWFKLKEWIDKSGCFLDDGSLSGGVVISIYAILDKMQELEPKGDE